MQETTDVLLDMSQTALVRAVEANLTEFHVLLSEWPEVTLHRDEDRIWTLSHRRFSLCNVLLEAHFDSARVGGQIDRAVTPYLKSSVNVMWKLGPSTQPSNLGDHLAERGFTVRPTLKGMAVDLTALAASPGRPPWLDIREVVDSATLALWRQAVDRGFSWPSYGARDVADNLEYLLTAKGSQRRFVAYVGVAEEAPVASSLVFFGAGVAGIYHVSTDPDHRGRGLGATITRAPLVEARSRGYRVAVLHATEMGYPVYRRLGFEDVCPIGLRLRLSQS
jgi:GNAT superfamily N-acetyltransferase